MAKPVPKSTTHFKPEKPDGAPPMPEVVPLPESEVLKPATASSLQGYMWIALLVWAGGFAILFACIVVDMILGLFH